MAAYVTYTTSALVVGTFHRYTADCSHLLFTERAGMLYATARSVREERSRQRYALQDFSLVRVSLVRGKSGWRVGSVEPRYNYYHQAADRAARGSVVSLCRLLRRFVHGEEPVPELFSYLLGALSVLAESVPHRAFVEQVVAVQVLAFLGYVDTATLPDALRDVAPEQVAAQYSTVSAAQVAALYTQAVSESHL